jgi:hypothetical protein
MAYALVWVGVGWHRPWVWGTQVTTKRLPRDLPQRDQAALSWYFTDGSAAFERSTMGPMLERAALYSMRRLTLKCRSCGGEGILADASWCEGCHGTGTAQTRLVRSDDSELAMPVHETRSASGGYTPDDSMMARYAVVSRRVSHLPAIGRAALGRYFGPNGERCSHAPGWRMIALYPLTPAGQRLAVLSDECRTDEERERFRGEPDYERCFGQVAWEASKTKAARKALIEAAEQQATELYLTTVDQWMGMTHEA